MSPIVQVEIIHKFQAEIRHTEKNQTRTWIYKLKPSQDAKVRCIFTHVYMRCLQSCRLEQNLAGGKQQLNDVP